MTIDSNSKISKAEQLDEDKGAIAIYPAMKTNYDRSKYHISNPT